ncbi:MAG: trypsin-like peptidase domain-containing protein [Lachnospiraceae bacterium]|nr:trypsin-like peptidase domain-containing protein [Lachnospiraceae bacterium]
MNENNENKGYENTVSENVNTSGYEVEELTADTRYDKYAAPSAGLNGTTFNGRKANFNPYTGEPLTDNGEAGVNNGPACTNNQVADTSAFGTGHNAYYVSDMSSSNPGHASEASQQASGSASPEFTYGSGAPTDVIQSSYISSYGTVYRSDGSGSGPAKPKKHMPGWLKVVLGSVAFGVIAAAVFIGTNKLYDSLSAQNTPTVNEESASNKHNIINKSSNNTDEAEVGSDTSDSNTITGSTVKKGSSNDAVASTQILTGNEVNYTDVSAVVENCMPSIVQINCTFNTQSFFGTYKTAGAGSGIIIGQTDSELLIATNNHVVENALDVKVTFDDNTDAEAYVKGTDAYADLAVVAVDISSLGKDTLKNIKVAVIGDSDSVKVGQMAIAIGNALGYGTSTTVGYISAKDREVDVDGKKMTLLQTDAAINPGNSGGALLNIKGEVIGINSVKYASSDVEGMGFAIPISRAVDILNDLATREVLKDSEKGYLGVQMNTVTSDFANAYGWPTGVYVNTVLEGSAAEKSGILAGDIITKINSVTVQTTTDLRNEITSYKAGTTVKITLQRLSRGRFSEIELDVTLGANPEYSE